MTNRFDVLVIGAGLAGLTCARELGRAGLRVAIADRKHDPGEKVHTTGIFVRKTFEEADLPLAFLGGPLRRVVLNGPHGASVALESERDEFRIGRMAELYRHLLREAEGDGVTWLPGVSFEGSMPDRSGSIVRLREGRRQLELRTEIVVGADGARSPVARDLGLDCNERFLVGIEDVFEATGSIDALHCFLDADLAPGYIGWVAGDSEEVHVGLAGDAGRLDPVRSLERFREQVLERFGIESCSHRERRGGLIPVGGVLRRIACRRGLLLGDAAGAVSPLTAGGLDGCVRLSAAAARLIVESVRRDMPSLLEEFDGRRFRARFVSRLWMRRAISLVSSNLLLDLGVRAASLPPLRAFARHVFFGRGSFPDVIFRHEAETAAARG